MKSIVLCILLVFLFGYATCDVNQDKAKCANQLVGLATCLPYVSGQANAPPIDCCKGFKEVIDKSAECVCILVRDRNDPSLGLQINATRALSLQTRCNAAGGKSITDCVEILHLAPNSPEAKVFEDFAHSGSNSSAPASATPAGRSTSPSAGATGVAGQANEGWKIGQRWLGMEMVTGLIITMVVTHNIVGQSL